MLYFDTSFVIPFILPEPTSNLVERFLARIRSEALAISHWTSVEFSSMLARRVRMGEIDQDSARDADKQFAAVATQSFMVLLPTAADFRLCRDYLRHYETGLRAGDALHLAIASNHGAKAIYSLDRGLLRAGRLLGLPVQRGVRLP